MENLVKYLLFLGMFFLDIPYATYGQRVTFGLSLPYALKTNLADRKGDYSILHSYGFCASIQIKGAEENNLIFQQNIGIWSDKNSYATLIKGEKIGITITSILINPEIHIPSKREKIKYCVGIGAIVTLTQSSFSGGNRDYNFQNIPIYMNDSLVDKNSRTLIPFVSIGFIYQFNKHISCQLFLTQTLRNYFEPNTYLTYHIQGADYKVSANYQPTLLGLRFSYFFNKSSHRNS